MILKQLYLGCLAQASYLIVDEKTKTALVVDPRRDIDIYQEEAERFGAEIRHALLTHFHADFLAGHLELRERFGVKIHLGARAQAEFAFEPMKDGETLVIGDVMLRFLETPGHTPESVSILVFDLSEDAEKPNAVLTGDTLFIGDVGRPDLMASIGMTSEDLAGMLYDSLRDKLLPLPDETLVYPGHGAGSACGKSLSTETFSTMGQQRATNYALQEMSKEEFIGLLTTGLNEPPPYFAYDALLNRSERKTLDVALEESLRPLELDEVLRLQGRGAHVLDVRTADHFADGHLPGAINVGLDGNYASWVGSLLDKDHSIVVITEPGTEKEAVLRLGRIGFDDVAGYLKGGAAPIMARSELAQMHVRLTPAELAERLAGDLPPLVVDVRNSTEWDEGHITEALLVPLRRLDQELARLPRDRELVCVCKTGYRSSAAASLLAKAGYEVVMDLAGGMDAWEGKSPAPEVCSS